MKSNTVTVSSYPLMLMILLLFNSSLLAFDYSSWLKSTKIWINTSSIQLESDVANFPLLIRLDDSNFNFNEARSDGADIRFSDQNGNPLQYEKVLWSEGNAELWVMIPVIFKSSNNQHIVMYWANASAENESDGPNVFKRTNSYTAVYHMNDITHIDDASATPTTGEYDGVNHTTVNVPGVMGNAAEFEGTDWIDLPQGVFSSVAHQITVELWQYGASCQPQNDRVIWGLDSYGYRAINVTIPWADQYIVWDCGHTYINGCHWYDRIETIAASSSDYKNQWNHWVFTKNTNTGEMKMYLNGHEYCTGSGKTYSIDVDWVRIGADNCGAQNYDGILDEIRFSGIQRSPSYIKLCYETQRQDQAVVWIGQENYIYPMHAGSGDNVRVDGSLIIGNVVNPSERLELDGKIVLHSFDSQTDIPVSMGNYYNGEYNVAQFYIETQDGGSFKFDNQGFKSLNGSVFAPVVEGHQMNTVNIAVTDAVTADSITANTIIAEQMVVTPKWQITEQVPDYVFDKNYNLPQIDSVEKYINTHGHLKDIPSAEEFEANGVDIVSINMKLLKKIEELTLYVIQLNKQLEIQHKKIKKLENRK